jgi:hypothetical protein
MSPEQILGKSLDRRSDVFALAVVMYEMLAIRRLFHRDSDFLTFKAITEEPIPEIRERRPDLPHGMRAALLQAMARDPNGRFDSALAFGNAIRNSVATLGGPATPEDLARLLSTDFADEMAARDEILKAADDPAPIAPPRPIRRSQPPPLPPHARSGEFGGLAQPGPVSTRSLDSVPSMIVQRSSSQFQIPSAELAALPRPEVLDLSHAVQPDSWMADPHTDLLRGHRLRSIRNAVITVAILCVLAAVIFFITTMTGATSPVAAPPPPPADADIIEVIEEPVVDAAPTLTRDDVLAISRYGFFSIAATAKTQIYIDNNKIGDTPLTRLPLLPGPHKVKAVGPRGKTKLFEITVYGGRDTDEGTITW